MATTLELEHKARRLWQREGPRKAVLVYQQICDDLPDSARHWALLGAALLEARRPDEAASCMRTSIWLRMREGDNARAASLARFLLSFVDSDRTAERALERWAAAA
jgi:Flp pilus assembly protein TadD